jgi:hypothetical protein
VSFACPWAAGGVTAIARDANSGSQRFMGLPPLSVSRTWVRARAASTSVPACVYHRPALDYNPA